MYAIIPTQCQHLVCLLLATCITGRRHLGILDQAVQAVSLARDAAQWSAAPRRALRHSSSLQRASLFRPTSKDIGAGAGGNENPTLTIAEKDWWISGVKNVRTNFSHLHKGSNWGYLSDEQYDEKVMDAASRIKPSIQEDHTLFELGMGVGASLKVLSLHFPSLRFGGSDVTQEAVEVACRALEGPQNTLPMLVQDMRLKHASIPDDSYDHVVSFGALAMYLQKDEMLKAIAEAQRITKPGGSLLFTDFVEPGGERKGSIVCPVEKAFWATHLPKLGLEEVEIHGEKHQGDRYMVACRKQRDRKSVV